MTRHTRDAELHTRGSHSPYRPRGPIMELPPWFLVMHGEDVRDRRLDWSRPLEFTFFSNRLARDTSVMLVRDEREYGVVIRAQTQAMRDLLFSEEPYRWGPMK